MSWNDRLSESAEQFKPLTFWSWNAALHIPDLLEQIGEMKQAGMGGFFMHARSGLKTEYMGEDWMDAVAACMNEAEKQNMQAWLYDENGWPSGFAGMKLLEDKKNHAHYISCEQVTSFDEQALANYTIDGNRLVRVKSSADGIKPTFAVYDHTNSSVVDILNRDIVAQFIALTHEKYYERYREDFGTRLLGFFTDEPQYFRYDTPYSPVLNAKYETLYGKDMLDHLGALFYDCEDAYAFRWRYWKLLNDTYTESFVKQIYEWCEAHNCQLTGHAIEESTLFSQMWCCAGVMPFYEYEHIPGCDWLGKVVDSEITPKQVGSVAQQLGKKRTITESFACTGWNTSPRELKQILDWQFVNGINTLCTHLTPLSLEGSRKFDHPAFFCKANPWFDTFSQFSDYIAKVGCMLSESREYAPVGVIHPMHSAYLTYNRATDAASVSGLETAFRTLAETLSAANIPHHYIDETLLAKYGSVKGDRLKMGLCEYEYILIPDMPQLDATTAELLRQYVKNGGKILLIGNAPKYLCGKKADLSFLRSNISWAEIPTSLAYRIDKQDTPIRSTLHRSPDGDFLFAVNLSKEETQTVTYTVAAAGAAKFQWKEQRVSPLPFLKKGGEIEISLCLHPGESVILLFGQYAPAAAESVKLPIVSFSEPRFVNSSHNSLVVDRVRISFDGQEYSDPMPVMGAADYLLSRCTNADVYLEYSFTVGALPNRLILETERMNAKEFFLNGTPLTFTGKGLLDKRFLSEEISERVFVGENKFIAHIAYYQNPYVYEVLYRRKDVTESLLNCLTYDTEIDSVFLHGDFTLSATDYRVSDEGVIFADGFAIQPDRPAVMRDITGSGYPFFAGEMTFRTMATVEGEGDVSFVINGNYGTAHIKWNAYETDAVLSNRVTVPREFVRTENMVEITLISGNRNLLGPFHHRIHPEPVSVYPLLYTIKDPTGKPLWKDGKNPNYRDNYSIVPFGIRLKSDEEQENI